MKFIEKLAFSLTITFLDRENSTLVRVIVIATKFPFFQASLDPGEATGWDVGDLFTLPVAFQPKSFYPPAPTLRLSSPRPTPRLSSDPNQFPTQSSFEPPPYPLSFTTSCFHELGRIPTYPGLSHIQDVSRESRRMSSKEKRRLWERDWRKSLKLAIPWRRRHLTTQYPLSFNKEATRKNKTEKKRKNRKRQKYLHFEKRKSLKSFRRVAGVAT